MDDREIVAELIDALEWYACRDHWHQPHPGGLDLVLSVRFLGGDEKHVGHGWERAELVLAKLRQE